MVDRNGPLSSMDKAWFWIVNMATNHDGEAQMQEYIRRSAQRGANGGAVILPTIEELQMVANLNV